MTKLYYLRGAFGDERLLAEHEKAINDLLNGTYASGDLEKLKGHAVYSFRLSHRARLLFALWEVAGQTYLVVLDYLPTHDYHKSRFLKAGVLSHYLEKQAPIHERLVGDKKYVFEALGEEHRATIATAQQMVSKEGIEYAVLDYYHQCMVELNPNQQEAIVVSLPAVVSGVAGSGKSCVSLSLLTSYLNAHPEVDETSFPLLYVSKSRLLVETIRGMWQELPLAQEHPDRIEFKTYDDLLPEDVSALRRNGEADFHAWYLKHIELQKRVARTRQQEVPEFDAATVYQELRIASAYDKDAYLKLGARQSFLPKEQRAWLYEIYEHYNIFLTEERHVDPALYCWKNDRKYALVIVDEAQDLSYRQLIMLEKMAQEHCIVYCLDSHQRLFDQRSVRPFLLQYFTIDERRHIELNVTYRCPVKIIAAANEVIALKHRLAGGIGDKHEVTRISAAVEEKGLGHLFVLKPEQLKEQPWLLHQATQPYCAVVTAKEYVEEAKEYFNTPLVFTPEEIKGLEYQIIIVYKLFKPVLFQEAHARLAALGGGKQSSPQFRPKSGAQDEHFGPAFNQIYTAYTRAQQVLVLCEPAGRHYNLLLDPLLALANKELLSEACLHLDRPDDWEAQIRIQLDVGNDAIAQAIFTTKLGKTLEEFQAFLLKHRARPALLPAVCEPATTCSSVAVVPEVRVKPEPTAVTPPKEKKKGSKSPKAIQPSPIELSHILTLAENFTATRLAAVHAVYGESIWLKPYLKADGQLLILADFLRQEPYRKIITSFLVSRHEVLRRVPVENLLAHFDPEQDQAVHTQLMRLVKVKTNFEKEMIDAPPKLVLEPIHLAAISGDLEQLDLLYELGANPNQTISGEENLVVLVAFKGNVAMLRALHKLGADFNQVSQSDGASPVHAAAHKGHIEVLRLFHELHLDLNREMVDGMTPAFIAAKNGHEKVLRVLHECRVNLDQRMTNGETLAYTAAKNGHVKVLRELHKLGIDLSKGSRAGATPAHIAAYHKQVDVLRLLHKLNVDLNQGVGVSSVTPVHIAAQNGHVEVLRLFQELRVDLDKAMTSGLTPIFIAVQRGDLNALYVFRDAGVDFRKILIADNATVMELFEHSCAEVKRRVAKLTFQFSGRNVELSLLDVAKIMDHSEVIRFVSKICSSSKRLGLFVPKVDPSSVAQPSASDGFAMSRE